MRARFANVTNGLIFEHTESMYPSRLVGHASGEREFSEAFTHTYGFVHSGSVTLSAPAARPAGAGRDFECVLQAGMHLSIPGPFRLAGAGSVALFQRIGFRGLMQIGGPIEPIGRLCYIDNCMNSVLVSPPRVGDPVLNYLSFPGNVEQTLHVHPSVRLGMIVGGAGKCVSPGRPDVPLTAGLVFAIDEAFPHCFHSSPEGLLLIAYHPDSDVGPSDLKNPMLSRTYREF